MKRSMLRSRIQAGPLVVAPGAYDALLAKLIVKAGFEAVYMTGGCTAVAHGYPDYGLITMTEMVTNAKRIVQAVNVPVVSDADTGYGNELNVVRTIQEFEAAGVAAIHIEDQTFPKRCGHLDRKELISPEAYRSKIEVAVSARSDPDFIIIARTDARASMGLEDAVRRANLALAAGADAVFVEAPQTLDEMQRIPEMVNGPCLLNLVRGGKTPLVDFETIERWGYRLVIVPSLLMMNVIGIAEAALLELRTTGEHPKYYADLTVADMFARVDAGKWDAIRPSTDVGNSAPAKG